MTFARNLFSLYEYNCETTLYPFSSTKFRIRPHVHVHRQIIIDANIINRSVHLPHLTDCFRV